jgi:hypothetical protein
MGAKSIELPLGEPGQQAMMHIAAAGGQDDSTRLDTARVEQTDLDLVRIGRIDG